MGNENSKLDKSNNSGWKVYHEYLDEQRNLSLEVVPRLELKINELEKKVEYLEAVVDSIWNGDESESTTENRKTELSDKETRLPF